MARHLATRLARSLLVGMLALLGACESPTTPDALPPAPEDAVPADPDTVAGSLRGFSLKPTLGTNALTLVANGSASGTCDVTDAGTVTYEVPLTDGMMRRISATYSDGGRVYVRPVTTHGFTGRGRLGYREAMALGSGGQDLDSFENEHEVVDPNPPVSVQMNPEMQLAEGELRAGDTLRLDLSASIRAELGTHCGTGTAGQVKWRMWGAILWLST